MEKRKEENFLSENTCSHLTEEREGVLKEVL
jgi:hypothetical protein